METTLQIVHVAGELGFTPLNLVLSGMLYFLGAQHGFFPKWWKTSGAQPATQASMDKLSSYYNHDTTEILLRIESNTKGVETAMDDLIKAFDNLEKSVDALGETQKEWEKFGIPIRTK